MPPRHNLVPISHRVNTSTPKQQQILAIYRSLLRVVLDYELKKRVYHELAKLGPDRASAESKRTVAERHGLQVVR